jgi:hypothetical protein
MCNNISNFMVSKQNNYFYYVHIYSPQNYKNK